MRPNYTKLYEQYEMKKAMYNPETDGDYEQYCKKIAKELKI